mmetsp:Transcript_21458/g.25893  ORF Transcript_21458/g.25893 Transcript_21458/m.25893 type:complete len:178 (-) Transcript_21458:65-598(-)|eukprot:CAMPEP_0195286584 /NCGR_PEP_ID=MMETSP0707-20130614/3994_1 /TAXON_ID=33640 /ORGANISM="Asterionellopsis glacialis, Strain CCMP134" /LENGTH=177 /DNA_ID=CAMNT_0040346245 /DNA_START=119 /DNA_END=652 /DNA_ORIENTATION=+
MSAQAFIAFLRCEANQAEERGKALRATAAAIEANAGNEVKKKRKRDSNRPKRQHTAYTMFVQENYESIKRNNDPNIGSKDIISMVARQWADTPEEEKQMWKARAVMSSKDGVSSTAATDETIAAAAAAVAVTDGMEEGLLDGGSAEDGDGKDNNNKGRKRRGAAAASLKKKITAVEV